MSGIREVEKEKRRRMSDGSVPEGRDGREKSPALGDTREERKEKREERDKHDRDDRIEGGNVEVPEGRYGREKGW